MGNHVTRRGFIAAASAVTAAAATPAKETGEGTLALLGGPKVRTRPFPSWPVTKENDEQAWMSVLRSGKWNRTAGDRARIFEERMAQAIGAKYCLATANGTASLFTALNALGIGPGDEVLVPPYTFVATVNAVLLTHALPVFVDSDPDTFQIDAHKIESRITRRTACIMPVHLGGAPADMDVILDVARRHKLPVIEDACQAHFAEWRGRRVSGLGDLGCFSFQASKNLNSGEGGAVITNNEDLINRCRGFHNNGGVYPRGAFQYSGLGANLRITEFQAALLAEQLTRVEGQMQVRERNAKYLTGLLKEIPGIVPAKQYEGCTRNANHLYMFRYQREHFANVPKSKFVQALSAEGVPCSIGYTPLNKEAAILNTLGGKAFRYIYSEAELSAWHERNHCPVNDQLCEAAIWMTQTTLLSDSEGMDHIAMAIRKIQKHANLLV
jgi:perosamine synthetase